MHIIRKSVFDIKNVESGNWGVKQMWKVEIAGGGGSKNMESGNWGVKNCGKWKLGGADTHIWLLLAPIHLKSRQNVQLSPVKISLLFCQVGVG